MRHEKLLDRTPLPQGYVHMMIQRPATSSGIRTKTSVHGCRATGIATYSRWPAKNPPAPPASMDRRSDSVELDEVERVVY